jgi:hypothetical protein
MCPTIHLETSAIYEPMDYHLIPNTGFPNNKTVVNDIIILQKTEIHSNVIMLFSLI